MSKKSWMKGGAGIEKDTKHHHDITSFRREREIGIMIRKVILIGAAVGLFVFSAAHLFAEDAAKAGGTTVGGHLKLLGYDYTDGKMNGINGHEYTGMSLRQMLVFLSSELSEKVSIDTQLQFDADTGATPKFGKPLQSAKNSPSTALPEFGGFVKAVVKVMLPKGYELSAGIVKPRFTWDYGAELFWEDEINGGKFSANTALGAMHETGIELYKPFEVGKVSLPAYLYIINNSSEYVDNNNGPMVMIHAEPEIGALKLLGSLGTGKYDDNNKLNNTRYAFGAAYEWNKFSARGEYAGGSWEKSIRVNNPGNTTTISDAIPWGYYVKVFYKATPWARLMLHYDYVDNNFSNSMSTAGSEKYTTITPGVQFRVMSSSSIIAQYDIADWKQKTASGTQQTLKFNRLTVGWRTTF